MSGDSGCSFAYCLRVATARPIFYSDWSARVGISTWGASACEAAEFRNITVIMNIHTLSFRLSVSCTCEIYRTKLC